MNSRTIHRTVPAVLAVFSLIGGQAAMAARGEITIPSDTVVKLKLDTHLTSKTARRGDHFAAVVQNDDRSGFPDGTRFQGTVTDVQRYSSKDRPGMLDVEFRNAYLPDGQRVAIDGRLASLADDDVRRTDDGRLESRKGGGKKPDWKWAGYGAGAGLVLSAIFGGNPLKGLLLGGVGGAAYGYLNKSGGKGKARDVDLPRGTEFGMQLMDRVAFQDRDNYNYYSRTAGYRGTDRVNDRVNDRTNDRFDDRSDSALVNGRTVRFDAARPHKVNGVPYFPLSAIADAAGMTLDWRRGERDFSLTNRDGRMESRVGDHDVSRNGRVLYTIQDPAVLEDGELYVSRGFLRQVGIDSQWNASANRWEINANR